MSKLCSCTLCGSLEPYYNPQNGTFVYGRFLQYPTWRKHQEREKSRMAFLELQAEHTNKERGKEELLNEERPREQEEESEEEIEALLTHAYFAKPNKAVVSESEHQTPIPSYDASINNGTTAEFTKADVDSMEVDSVQVRSFLFLYLNSEFMFLTTIFTNNSNRSSLAQTMQ